MANVTCLAAARHRLLAGHGWDTEQDGLFGAPPIRVLAGHTRHGSIDRALRLLGVGRSQIVELTSDAEGRIDQNACEDALTRGQDAPTVLILQAGDVNIGACDEFTALIPCAKRLGAWVHVDGAFGLWAATSPRLKALVAGVEAADSWATDGHKWLNVPYDCGYAFVADPDAHSAAMSHRATYLVHDVGGRDSIDWNPEWSRRARCFSTYAALRHLGRTGVGELVERCCRHARDIAEGIGELAGAELLWRPTLNQGLVRFLCPRPSATQEDHDRFTDDAIAAIAAQGEAFFSGTSWRGRRAMRISVCSWRTGSDDVRRTVASVRATLADLREHELSQ
jgi:glutamate/tyrosine decarboxylase-like PLP-dependent enzyme